MSVRDQISAQRFSEVIKEGKLVVGADIVDPVELTGARLDRLLFRNCRFLKSVIFKRCVFLDEADFEGCFFAQGVAFPECRFHKFLMLRGAWVGDRAVFSGATFYKGLSLASGEGVSADGQTTEHDKVRHLKFEAATFSDYVTFNNRTVTRSATFDRSIFNEPPHFQNAVLHPGTTFDKVVFHVPPKGDQRKLHRAENAFRALKRIRYDHANIGEAIDFHALELIARRRQKISPIERSLIWLYGVGSDFGRSLFRPIIFIAVAHVFSIAGLEFLRGAGTPDGRAPLTLGIFADYFAFLIQQTVNPFSTWHSDYAANGALKSILNGTPSALKALASLHTMAAGTAIGLFVHAAKRRFE